MDIREHIKTDSIVRSGYVRTRDEIYVISHYHPADAKVIAVAELFVLERGTTWRKLGQFDWEAVGITVTPNGEIIVAGREGEVATIADDKISEDRVDPYLSVGPIAGVRCVQDTLVAYGGQRHLFRRPPGAEWSRWILDPSTERLTQDVLGLAFLSDATSSINALVGYSLDDLYALGKRGEIWHHDGDQWRRKKSPTGRDLRAAAIAADEQIVACGANGTVIRGRHDSWSTVEVKGAGKRDFCSAATYRDISYLAYGRSMRALINGDLKPVEPTEGAAIPAHRLHASDDALLAVSGKSIYLTEDGQRWQDLLT